MHRIDFTPAYVLHTRPFRNTSLIVDFFSQVYGRVSAVARSARGPKSRYQGQLQLFTPLLISWSGRHELKTLGAIELTGMPLQLNQKPLFCGFYCNELLMRLLHKEDPHADLFGAYHDCLHQLENGSDNQLSIILRLFEKKLLASLGYGLSLTHESKTRTPIQPDGYYHFVPQQGFLIATDNTTTAFLGRELLLIAEEKLGNDAVMQSAKRLMRLALSGLLGDKPLHSREFF